MRAPLGAPLATAFAALALATSAPAQQTFQLDVQPAASNLTWTASTSVGSVVGVPDDKFQATGTLDIEFQSLVNPLDLGRIVAADLGTLPVDLVGEIPNPIPFLPPLAVMEVKGLRVSLQSPTFSVDGSGNFVAVITSLATAGTLDVTPFGGSTTSQPLAGFSSAPTPIAGVLSTVGGDVSVTANLALQFSFQDPASGVSGTFDISGPVTGQWTCPLPSTYCTSKPNSLGCAPQIGSTGMASASSAAAFDVSTTMLLNNKPGIFFYGYAPAAIPFQGGFLCVAPPTRRTAAANTTGNPPPNDCSGSLSIDFNGLIQGGGDPGLEAGASVYVQTWSRDPQSPSTTSLSNGLEFTICP